ncbi:MAG: flagellar biosynthesis protein FlhF [Sulfurovum sp.]|nr:flagellar biosynthesis protein FlhF [Sulfurovum sp.]
MVEETFVAPNPREAFEIAKEKYGHFSKLKLLKAVQVKDEAGKLVSRITVSVSSKDFFESIGLDEEEELVGEIVELKTQIENMKNLVSPAPASQKYIENIKNIMFEKGLGKAWIDKILKGISEDTVLEDEQLLLSYILDEIDDKLSVKAEDMSQSKMMMLIGSTGVGKTTTVAKLAARYALLLDRPLRVALVNLDTFRVGAYEQLEHYAVQMQIEHIKVERVEEFETVLFELEGYDVILIDTAGISPYDTGKLIKTIEFLQSTGKHNIETSLVVSATAKRDDIVDIYEHFSFLDIDSAILTKFDETKKIGELFGFLIENDIPVSYISSGQSVPDDLELASKEKLMDRFMSELNV